MIDRFSFNVIVIEELHCYKQIDGSNSEILIDENLKMVAFNFGKRNRQQTFFKLVVITFNLVTSKHLFVDKIKELIAEKNYKDVRIVFYVI